MQDIRDMVKPILAGECHNTGVIQEHSNLDEGIRTRINIFLDDISKEDLENVKGKLQKALEDCGFAPQSYDELMKAAGIKSVLGESKKVVAEESNVSGTTERALINLCGELIHETWTTASESEIDQAIENFHVTKAEWKGADGIMWYQLETEIVDDEGEEMPYWFDIRVRAPSGVMPIEDLPTESIKITQRKRSIREGDKGLTVYDIADAIEGQNMRTFSTVLRKLNVGWILGAVEGAAAFTTAPTVLVHTNTPERQIDKGTNREDDYFRFTVVDGSETASGSLLRGSGPLKTPKVPPAESLQITQRKRLVKEGNVPGMTSSEGRDLWSSFIDSITGLRASNMVEEMLTAIGYSGSYELFFDDNPGAVEAIERWIVNVLNRVPEWQEAMRSYLAEKSEEE